MARKSGGFTVSGPGVDKEFSDGAVAVSAAITSAERLRKKAGTFYVRNLGGTAIARVEHDAKGRTFVHSYAEARQPRAKAVA